MDTAERGKLLGPPLPPAVARPQAGSGRQMVMVGSLLAMGAIGLIVVTNLLVTAVSNALLPTTQVVVAARDIQLRAHIGRDDVTLVPVAKKDVLPGAFHSAGDVARAGYLAEVNISKGQPITENMLSKSADAITGPQPAFLPIPRGFVASTLPTGEFTGVAGFIQAGDYINIVTTISSGVLEPDSQTSIVQTVFTNVHVIRIGRAAGHVDAAGQSGSVQTAHVVQSLTIITTQCDAEYLSWLHEHSQLTYTLGSYKDYQPQDTRPDPNCKDATAATGVGPKEVNARWKLTSKSLGPGNYLPSPPTN